MRISDWSSDVCSSDLYFTRIAPVLLPHVAGRPVTRKRWPDGVGTAEDPGMSFFAKDLEAGAPSWVRRQAIPHSSGSKDYPLVGDVPTLVYLAQVASLELHVPQWRFAADGSRGRSEEHTSELQSLMRISYAVFCLKKKHKQRIKK